GVQQSGHRRSSSRLNVLQPVCQQIGTIRREVRLAYGAVWRRAPCSSRCLTRHHETEETLRAAMASRPDRPSGRHHHDAEPVHCDEAVAILKKASNYRHLTMRDLAEDIAGRADLQPAFTRRRLITTRDDPSRPLLVVFEHPTVGSLRASVEQFAASHPHAKGCHDANGHIYAPSTHRTAG